MQVTPVSSAVSSTSVNHTSPSLTPPVSADAATVKTRKKEARNQMQFPIQIKHQTVKSTERKYFSLIVSNVVPNIPKGQKGKTNILLPHSKCFYFKI